MNRAFVAGSNGPPSWEPLKYARKDAEDLAGCLSAARCGFQVEMPSPDVDPLALRGRLYAAADACAESDTFLCYFSGHGILEQGSLFLLWDKTDVGHLLSTGLPASALTEAMRHSRANNKLLILDCCHAGAAVGLGFRDISNVRAQEVVAPENHLVLMASDRLQRARELEGLAGGFMTQQLCAALSRSFSEAAGSDRRLSIGDAKVWLEEQAARHNKDDPDHAVPIPYLFGQQRGDFFFTAPRDEWQPTTYELAGCEFVLLPFQWASGESETWVVLLGKYPVLNRDYRRFVDETGATEPEGENFEKGHWTQGFRPWQNDDFRDPLQPVVCITLPQAWKYTHWFRQGVIRHHDSEPDSLIRGWPEFRIPTFAEWDSAAFGSEHPSRNPQNWLTSSPAIHQAAKHPAPIDPTGGRANRFGLADMIGNIWEWCDDADDDLDTRPPSVYRGSVVGAALIIDNPYERHPAGLRGGGYLDDLTRTQPFVNEWELRERRDTRHSDVGFRLAIRLPIRVLPDDLRERVETCDLHASSPTPMRMPPTA